MELPAPGGGRLLPERLGERADELRALGRIRFSAHFVTKVAFAMETAVLVCHVPSVGTESVLV